MTRALVRETGFGQNPQAKAPRSVKCDNNVVLGDERCLRRRQAFLEETPPVVWGDPERCLGRRRALVGETRMALDVK